MKHTILAFLFCFGLLHSHAADEPLIPAALNAILPRIHAGMTIREVEAVLAPAYPKVKGQMGNWSGQTGYIDYKLDERHTLSVSSITRDGKELVHDEILLYLYDWPSKRRLDLKIYEWEKQTAKKPQPNERSGFLQQRNLNEKPYPPIGQSLAEPDVPAGLWERMGDKIVAAPAEDLALAKTYREFKNKGPLVVGQRITIMTHHARCRMGEPLRVLHILEAVEPGKSVHLMGPKKVYDEYVDGKLVTSKGPGAEPYNGMVADRPIADFNYEITTYTFTEPGVHTIQWKGGGASAQGSLGLESNIIKLEVLKQ